MTAKVLQFPKKKRRYAINAKDKKLTLKEKKAETERLTELLRQSKSQEIVIAWLEDGEVYFDTFRGVSEDVRDWMLHAVIRTPMIDE